MSIKVKMYPHLDDLENHASGIAQVIKHYFRYLPDFDIELVGKDADSYDLDAAHAAAHPSAMVSHLHGLMWTAEMELGDYGHNINRELLKAIRLAREVTVPSPWVAMPLKRDMHFSPHIIRHGVEWQEWQHSEEPKHILWAKNRVSDGLSPAMFVELARRFPRLSFVTTFAGGIKASTAPPNLRVIGGAIPSGGMKKLIQQSLVFIASDRETFGIAPLEAMAAGVPVLTIDAGEVPNLLSKPGYTGGRVYSSGIDKAAKLLQDMLTHRKDYSRGAVEIAKQYDWPTAVSKVANVYRLALTEQPPTVDVVIPCHNYHDSVETAVRSVMRQGHQVKRIIVVDDNSEPGIKVIVCELRESDQRVEYHRVEFGNVALTRNYGARLGDSKYLIFLDADDAIEPGFTTLLTGELERDRAAGIAYTGMIGIAPDYQIDTISRKVRWNNGDVVDATNYWDEYDFDIQMQRHNLVPSCCLVRREAFERAGGFNPMYCPEGAGSEDAELWLRLGSLGWGTNYVYDTSTPARWIHTHGGGHVSGNEGYEEPDWTAYHPWTRDGNHPFASIAQPENGIAHPVHSYEQPEVSIIIPVGPGHDQHLLRVLHTIEGQTFRDWEVIVVFDGRKWDDPQTKAIDDYYKKAFPYVNWLMCQPRQGAGAARNVGVRNARGKYLAFIDADDRILPNYLETMLATHKRTGKIPYSNWIALVDEASADAYGKPAQKVSGGKAYIEETIPDWSCQKAVAFPEGDGANGVPYNVIGTNILLPKEWMIPYNEEMETWEDVLLGLELAWHGREFVHIQEPLWIYDLVSGTRRWGRSKKVYEQALEIIQRRHKETDVCGCNDSPQQNVSPTNNNSPFVSAATEAGSMTTVDVIYNGRGGSYWLIGAETGKRYAYVSGNGDLIKGIDMADVRAQLNSYTCAYCHKPFQFDRYSAWCDCQGQRQAQGQAQGQVASQAVQNEQVEKHLQMRRQSDEMTRIIDERRRKFRERLIERQQPAPPEPEPVIESRPRQVFTPPDLAISEDEVLLSSTNINFRSLKALNEEGIETVGQAQALGPKGLMKINGVGEKTAGTIMEL